MDVLLPCLESAAKRLPAFANAGIKRVVCGPITHVPDLGILIGPAAGLRNFWMCCGSSVGITQGPGAGKYLAQWMVHGQAEIDVSQMDARRFGDWAVGDYTNEKSLDGYHYMFQVQLPGNYHDAGRPVRPTPLYNKLKSHGARFAEISGWEIPNWFAPEGVEEIYSYRRTNWFEPVALECQAVRERVGVTDKTSLAKFEVSGDDATAFLECVLASQLPQNDGDIVTAYALTEKGSIECEFSVTRLSNNQYYLLGPIPSQLRSFDWLSGYSSEFTNLTLTDVTDNYGVLALAGPKSREVLAKLTEDSLSNEDFAGSTARNISVAGISTRTLRVFDTGELGWEMHVPIDKLEPLYDAVIDAGGEFQIANFGLYAANSLRMENASKSWKTDLISPNTAVEAGIEASLRTDKPFIGAEVVAQNSRDKVTRTLVYLEVDTDDAEVFGNEQVFSDGIAVGLTTSGAFGHTVQKSLAFAYVDPKSSKPGTELEIDILRKRCSARVLTDALHDPQNTRAQS
jgi:dimethylglycine dehydrogenase